MYRTVICVIYVDYCLFFTRSKYNIDNRIIPGGEQIFIELPRDFKIEVGQCDVVIR